MERLPAMGIAAPGGLLFRSTFPLFLSFSLVIARIKCRIQFHDRNTTIALQSLAFTARFTHSCSVLEYNIDSSIGIQRLTSLAG